MQENRQAHKITIKGLVQGVGFRPFVYRLAHELGLPGRVRNTNDGLRIHIEGSRDKVEHFVQKLRNSPPEASVIHTLEVSDSAPVYYTDFLIEDSVSASDNITQVSPDIAVCDDCLYDMNSQSHRLDYPFINCTHCGPRFTIIRDLPYDRAHTTMAPFTLCETCRTEFETPDDRRFHAQPVACARCGPEYTLHVSRHRKINGTKNILKHCRELMANGGVIAIKGLGGFHLMCDVENEKAVEKLRNVKQRDGKPFAVMVKDIDTAFRYAELSAGEAGLLQSWRRPIVLVRQKKPLPEAINPGLTSIGIMLPYMPFHHLLFREISTPAVVMTSGNLADEPIVTDNKTALDTFCELTDAVLVYNRDIQNRADDSVAFVGGGKSRLIRRSRGYVPEPVRLSFPVEGFLGTGAELSHCFAIGKGEEVLLSQHIGDLKDPLTYAFFEESVTRLGKLFRSKPAHVVCDIHPDYLSTHFAEQTNLPLTRVQHHHAHIAACMAEYRLNKPVIGVCWDGTGLGTDGHIWGSEFMVADLSSFKRYNHFDYLPLPGGDKAAKETWRTGIALLYKTFGKAFADLDLPVVQQWRDQRDGELMLTAIDRNLNTPLSSAAGRLFDAVAAITGICSYNSFHAEAPMKLESGIDETVDESYPFDIRQSVSFGPMIRAMVQDIRNRIPLPVISAKFHNTLIFVILSVTDHMKKHYEIDDVVLTGGVFQNRYLLEQAGLRLKNHFNVYSPQQIPCNDAGISLGQIAVAAHNNRNTLNRKQSGKKTGNEAVRIPFENH